MKYVKFSKLYLKTHPEFTERWVQERIAETPSILGLGDVIVKDMERMQPRAGRLDLLLQKVDGNRRYEVEIQLGSSDESHVIRTIEYWDIERKRYPQYDHTAVLVAEDITSRFLNVIGLFNGFIPLIAIQMNALTLDEQVGLHFTTVLDQLTLGLIDEDEGVKETTDRAYWEKRASKETLAAVDALFQLVHRLDGSLELKYKGYFIGLARQDRPYNFVIFKPQIKFVRLEPRLPWTPETQQVLESAGLDVVDYQERWGRYSIRLSPGDVTAKAELLAMLMEQAYQTANK